MNPEKLINSGISFNIADYSLNGYKRVFEYPFIIKGYINSIIYSVLFSIITTMVSILAAYPMSKKEFVGKKFFNIIFLITMFFSGGLIPTYLLIDNLRMLDTIWAILLPGAVNVWNIILARTYFKNLPKDLREASEIDGVSEVYHFFKIVFPLSKPIIAVFEICKTSVIIPVEDLIDNYMPNLKKILDENPEYRKLITDEDGHIYSFPWIEQLGSDKEAIQSIGSIPWINKKWLDELGLPIPTTTDELYNTFKVEVPKVD